MLGLSGSKKHDGWSERQLRKRGFDEVDFGRLAEGRALYDVIAERGERALPKPVDWDKYRLKLAKLNGALAIGDGYSSGTLARIQLHSDGSYTRLFPGHVESYAQLYAALYDFNQRILPYYVKGSEPVIDVRQCGSMSYGSAAMAVAVGGYEVDIFGNGSYWRPGYMFTRQNLGNEERSHAALNPYSNHLMIAASLALHTAAQHANAISDPHIVLGNERQIRYGGSEYWAYGDFQDALAVRPEEENLLKWMAEAGARSILALNKGL